MKEQINVLVEETMELPRDIRPIGEEGQRVRRREVGTKSGKLDGLTGIRYA